MAQLGALVLSNDEEFRRRASAVLRAGAVPIGILEERQVTTGASEPDLVFVDVRVDAPAGLASIERVRADHASTIIFAIAGATEPDLILQAMRAGANEFFTWPPEEEAFRGAIRRAASRREGALASARQPSRTTLFFGAKGGAGTTTIAVNCAVELARHGGRPTVMVDLKPGLGEAALFLGIRPRFSVLDAIENIHRLDREFLRELLARHKSGLEVLAASDQFDRPGPQDAGAVEELFRILARTHDHIIVDAGNSIGSCTLAALYAADSIFLVTNPDVPSVRNAQRLVERVRQLGAGAERVQVILNRTADHLLIGPKQIEAALGYRIEHTFPSDYAVVSAALNSGVPLTMTNHSELAAQFSRFTNAILGGREPVAPAAPEKKRAFRGPLYGALRGLCSRYRIAVLGAHSAPARERRGA
ncbi:MAG: AAA family ATPase [Acidobacteria bacterium]|nr:AAA family ATPase [Acidobacteriota bacterium]